MNNYTKENVEILKKSAALAVEFGALPQSALNAIVSNLIKNLEENKPQPGRALTYGEAAKRWSCSKRHIQYLCEKGELPTVKIGKRGIRIPESSLYEYFNK